MNTPSIVVQAAPGGAQQLFLLFHGYGANAEDLVPLAEQLARAFPQATVVSVGAPETMGYPGGRQWFSLDGVNDLNRIQRVTDAMPSFLATIRHWQQQAGVDAARTALVGFSQGTIMALEASLSDPPPAGRVIGISGRFARLPAAVPASVTFHLFHGKDDAVVPCQHTIDAAQRLLDLEGDVTADLYAGTGHEIPDALVADALRRLTTHVPKRLWDEALRAAQQREKDE